MNSKWSVESALKKFGYRGVVNFNQEDLKSKYRKLSKKYHPDSSTGCPEKFKLVIELYEFLQNCPSGVYDLTDKVCLIEQGSTLFEYKI